MSASDLANHLACRHATELDRAVAEGRREPPAWRDPAADLLRERGFRHEARYVESLRARGLGVMEAEGFDGTLAAMRAGAGAIVQAVLEDGRWLGRADVLLRVESPSDLGGWSYEVVDTKLSLETRGATVLQLCLYSDLLAALQGRAPEFMRVVKPDGEEAFRVAEFGAYYRFVKRRLESVLAAPPAEPATPPPVPHCDVCRWWQVCDRARRDADHLSLVAGMSAPQAAELRRAGVNTLEAFAESDEPAHEPLRRVHAQARIQLEGRRARAPRHELLDPEPQRGLARLPEPDEGDLFFDVESDPFVEGGGLEYLLGVSDRASYRAFRALDRAAEKRAFEAFVDFVMERWRVHPGMHVYHFSPYEPAALKRLMGRHATRAEEIDRLLRGGRFVDLHAVVRQGLRASVESYSLKALEPFYGFERAIELRDAGAALRAVSWALELGGEVAPADLDAVEAYNRDDCLSTAALRDWLETRRGEGHARPESGDGAAPESVEERAAEVQEVFDRLVAEPSDDARRLLANLLEYFRREDRVAWWEFFRVHELEHDALLDERKAATGLRFVGETDGGKRTPVHRYLFPPQEMSLKEGDELWEVGGGRIGHVFAVETGVLDVKKRKDSIDRHPRAVLANERVAPEPIDGSLLAFARAVADGDDGFRAARDLLHRRAPRGPLRLPGEAVVDAAVRAARALDGGVLAIQGPPGTGKTFTGAETIAALAADGARIGVTAVSHKVIRNLLGKVAGRADVLQKVSRPGGDGFPETTDNAEALRAVREGRVVGGTAWLWARPDMAESLDYLFVDEAGQMSLAHVLGAAGCARNLVLLGDPQQLEQPQRGAHPEGAEVAALVHLLEGRKTIPDDEGLFLDVTWRLHPSICAFTSEVYYEGRLSSRPGLERQAVLGDTRFAGSGLFYVPVDHEANQSSSPEEVEAVARVVEELTRASWRDGNGDVRPVTCDDAMVIAPYNAQVDALAERLPGVAVGTVDRFQGQEAPVVVYSMASSSAQDAPRGMEFLYSPNRLNVATSRARCACILAASPRLFEPDCRTPDRMRRANGLCRYRELATEVRL